MVKFSLAKRKCGLRLIMTKLQKTIARQCCHAHFCVEFQNDSAHSSAAAHTFSAIAAATEKSAFVQWT